VKLLWLLTALFLCGFDEASEPGDELLTKKKEFEVAQKKYEKANAALERVQELVQETKYPSATLLKRLEKAELEMAKVAERFEVAETTLRRLEKQGESAAAQQHNAALLKANFEQQLKSPKSSVPQAGAPSNRPPARSSASSKPVKDLYHQFPDTRVRLTVFCSSSSLRMSCSIGPLQLALEKCNADSPRHDCECTEDPQIVASRCALFRGW
jgi:hypothetical protein